MKQAYTLLALLGFAVASCNQDDSNTVAPSPTPTPTPTTSCRLIAVRNQTNTAESRTFTYDANKRPATMEWRTTTRTVLRTYTPINGGMTSRQVSGGLTIAEDTILVNSNGFVTRLALSDLADPSESLLLVYDYNGDKVSKLTLTGPGTGQSAPITTTFEYNAAGDMVKQQQDNGAATTYEYYTDKSARTGDVLATEGFIISGARLYNNAHLLKNRTVSGVTTTYTYEFDSNDRITKYTQTRPGAPATVYTVEQNCD